LRTHLLGGVGSPVRRCRIRGPGDPGVSAWVCLRVASFEESVGEVLCGSGDVLSGSWDVEVVSDLGEEVGAALLKQGQSLSESAQVAVEGRVPEVGRVGLGGGIADGAADVAFDQADDTGPTLRCRCAVGWWCHGARSVAPGRQIS
jgi:hypothetical protein